jgi:hypothetical protein
MSCQYGGGYIVRQHLYGKIAVNPNVITPFNPPPPDSLLDNDLVALRDNNTNPLLDNGA